MIKVLVAGKGSYIGESFRKWADFHYGKDLSVDSLDMQGRRWKEKDFSDYDCVFHVAGIAHVDAGHTGRRKKYMYYSVNRDLAFETANKAKKAGVSQFIFMSSIIIYGDAAPCDIKKRIKKNTHPAPSNCYGDSKWQAEKGLMKLADTYFKVAIVRSPMVYGRGCKGNYVRLSHLSRILPVFPAIRNERSMIFIDNLCEFLCMLILRKKEGVFFPQNREYVSTSQMAEMIAGFHGHPIHISTFFNRPLIAASHMPGRTGRLLRKVFGNLSYEMELSSHDFDYCLSDLEASIERTET